ncbi:hypothetical protein SAMN04487761_14222 [Lachnospiraceae bacterium C7]|nr:hypothetical protein SAMN04487761_14222 [Lachnospiraceae bacterium C7]
MSRLFKASEMARIACTECSGCGDCCKNMGDTIKVDPYDFWKLSLNLGATFEELTSKYIGMHVEEGIVTLNMMLSSETNKCVFLNDEDRCSIHKFRPGICRLFPLGRNYEDGKFDYFIVEEACGGFKKHKIKIDKWLGINNLKDYEKFISVWHYFIKNLQEYVLNTNDEQGAKILNMLIIKEFYMKPFETNDDNGFYVEFYYRLEKLKEKLNMN